MKRVVPGALLILFGLIGIGLYLLLVSQEGIRLSIKATDRFLPGQFSVDSVHGHLLDQFVLEGFHYSDGPNVVSIDRLLFSWHPASLWQKKFDISSLEMNGVYLAFPADHTDDSAADEIFSFPSFTLPLSINVDHATIDSILIKTTEDTPETRVTNIVVDNLSGEENLMQVGNFEIASDQYRVVAQGQVQTGEVYSTRLNVDYSLNNIGLPSLTGTGVLDGSLEELKYEAHFLSPFIGTVKGVVSDLAGDMSWKGSIAADQIILSQLNKEWPEVAFTEFQTSGEGTLSSYTFQATTNAAYDSFQDIRVSLKLNSGGNGLLPSDGSLEELEYEAHFVSPFIGTVKGVVSNLAGDMNWKGSIVADQINLSQLNKEWPQITFTEFQTSGEGTLSSYTFQATTNAAYDSFQDIGISANIIGDDSGLQVTGARVNHEKTLLSGKGQLAWKDMLTWQANLTGTQINPALYDQRWPGNLNLEAFTSGQLSNGELKTDIDLIKLDGKLRGFPVLGKGKIEMDGKDLAIDSLTIQSADSFLLASGRFAESIGLDFKLKSSNLETLWPDLSGSIEASGRISGNRQQPEFQFDLSGNKIVLGETKISDVLASGTGVMTSEGSVNASFAATDVTVAGTLLDTIAADLKGTLQDHLLEARINAPHASTMFKVDGGYSDKKWNGFISNWSFETDLINNWQLQEPASIALSAGKADIGKLCLIGMHSALVCIEGKYEQAGHWSAKADITALPVDMFRNMQSRFNELGGIVSGTASVKGQGTEIFDAGLDISADNFSGRLDFSEDYSREIVWRKNAIHAVLDGSTVDVKVNSILQDGSSLTAEAVLNDIGVFPFSIEKTGIQGSLHFDIMDLQPLSAISYPDIEPYGTLKGVLDVRGKLMQPDYFGHAQLEQGKMILPSLGITVKDVEMRFNGKDNRLQMEVTANSGSGTLHAEGDYALPAQDNRPVEIAITGDNFEIVNLPEARINVSPELTLKISKQRGELQGNILLTEAYIFLENLGGTVSSSKDIVFVDDHAKKEETAWPFYTKITLNAGENVRVNAYGLRGLVGGQLQIIDQPTKTAIGEGALNVREGTFSIYGRQLKIVKGRLLYSGNPLDNPGIDVRAESIASGVTTGIQVSGFLREPDISFYSTPAMEKDEIIQRLLMNTSLIGSSEDEGFLGSVTSKTALDPLTSAVQDVKESLRVDDVKIETGKKSDDLSLVIGTWLTPKLYVSYGKNLLKESDNFNTRYVLGRGFSFETETGTTDSGFDLMYEIDK